MAERSALFRAAAIAGSVAASLNLAACGGGGSDGASSTAAPVPPPASPPPPGPAPAPGAAPPPATPPPPSPPSPGPSPVPPPAPPPGPPPPSLSLNPNAIERLLLNGEAKRFPIEVRLSGTLPPVVYVLVTDSGSAFNPTIALNCFSVDACDAIATTQSTLPLGTTTGALTARLCSDQACANQITSASIAYRFNVVAPGAQPPLTRLVGVDEWSTEQGNAAHTGYMPTTLDPAKFSVRWKWIPPNLPASGPNVLFWSGPMVSSSQKQLAYVAANVSDGSASRLYAVRETDGTLGWEVSYQPLVYPGPPAAYGERVYTVVLNGNGARDGQFLAYDATTGNYVFSTLFAAECPQGCWPGAPVVVDGIAYVNPGSNSVVGGARPAASAFHTQTGGLLWSAATGGSAMQALAVDASRAYLYAPNSNVQAGPGFTALNKITGATEFGVPGNAAPIGAGQIYYQGDAPVLDGSGAAYFRLNRRSFDAQVQAVNLRTGQRLWESGGSSATVLAVADGAVFCANRELWALSTSDGKPLWVKWLPPMFAHTQMDRVLLTRNLIFVSTSEDVFAFDRVTRDLVWSFPIGGQISLSASGLLYVVAPTAVYAINLQ